MCMIMINDDDDVNCMGVGQIAFNCFVFRNSGDS